MLKKILAISSILLASIVAVVAIKGDAISFAKSLKGTDMKAKPVAKAEKLIVVASAGNDCF